MTSGPRTLPATLIATLGTEPQVVTAALDLLQRQGEVISQVIVLHSLSPGTLIAEAVEKLRHEFDNPSGEWSCSWYYEIHEMKSVVWKLLFDKLAPIVSEDEEFDCISKCFFTTGETARFAPQASEIMM